MNELVAFMLACSVGVPDAKLRDRIDAGTWLADRGFGKPVQAMERRRRSSSRAQV
jgi:hypothetical protein